MRKKCDHEALGVGSKALVVGPIKKHLIAASLGPSTPPPYDKLEERGITCSYHLSFRSLPLSCELEFNLFNADLFGQRVKSIL